MKTLLAVRSKLAMYCLLGLVYSWHWSTTLGRHIARRGQGRAA